MTAPRCVQQFFLMESLIIGVYQVTDLVVAISFPGNFRLQQSPVQEDAFLAVLTHSHQTLSAVCHDRAEEQHISRYNVSAEAFITSSTFSQLCTRGRDEETGAEILLYIHFKALAATSWKNATEKSNIYFFCLLISFISYSAVTVIKMLKGNFM